MTHTDKGGHVLLWESCDGDYTIVPSLDGYTFTPALKSVTIAGENVLVQPFIGVEEGGGNGSGDYTISGRVTDAEGKDYVV